MRPFSIVVLFLILLQPVAAQERHVDDAWTKRMAGDAVGGLLQVGEWYDIPVTLLFLARNSYKADNPSTKLVSFPPLTLEQELAKSVGSSGQSLGSMDAWILPAAILGSRLLYAAGMNITSDANMQNTYAHAWAYYKVLAYNLIATELFKNLVRRSRPDNSDTKSFFSGHTSTNFVTSAFLYREAEDALDDWDAVQSTPALRTALKAGAFTVLYGWAAYVGYSRMADNKHYLTDVLVGAAVGTLIGNLVYDHYFSSTAADDLPDVGIGMLDRTPVVSFSMTF